MRGHNSTFIGSLVFNLTFRSAVFVLGGNGPPPFSEARIVNCITQTNGFPVVASPPFQMGAFVPIHSNIVGELYSENGNIGTDPQFIDPENGDYRLQSNSPCIDSGTTVELFDDLDGNPRPKDVPGVGVDGEGAFDMGAYEYQSAYRNSRTDINGDGVIDAMDLLILQADWGKVSGPSE